MQRGAQSKTSFNNESTLCFCVVQDAKETQEEKNAADEEAKPKLPNYPVLAVRNLLQCWWMLESPMLVLLISTSSPHALFLGVPDEPISISAHDFVCMCTEKGCADSGFWLASRVSSRRRLFSLPQSWRFPTSMFSYFQLPSFATTGTLVHACFRC